MRKIKQVTLQIIAGGNIATIIILLMTGYSGWLRPETFPMLSNIGLLLPVLIVINLGFLVFWVLIKSRGMLIPIAGFLLSYVPVRQYCPVNIPQSAPAGSFKVLSYNVWQFGDASHPNPILEYIKAQKADIVCLQEANINALGGQYVDSVMQSDYPFRDTIMHGGDVVAMFSKFPIHGKERIQFESKGNVSAAFRVQIQGRTVIVINNHLESTGLSPEEKSDFKLMVKGDLSSDTARHVSKKQPQRSEPRKPRPWHAISLITAAHRSSSAATSTTAPCHTSTAPSPKALPTAMSPPATDPASAIMSTDFSCASTTSSVPTTSRPTIAISTAPSRLRTIILSLVG